MRGVVDLRREDHRHAILAERTAADRTAGQPRQALSSPKNADKKLGGLAAASRGRLASAVVSVRSRLVTSARAGAAPDHQAWVLAPACVDSLRTGGRRTDPVPAPGKGTFHS
jgi:hypothetical protein